MNRRTFLAVLDHAGVFQGMTDDNDVMAAGAFAASLSPSRTVLIDQNVYAAPAPAGEQNPPLAGKDFAQASLRASGVQPLTGLDWSRFDPLSAADKGLVEDARRRLRERGRELYGHIKNAARGLVHSRDQQGRIAVDFKPAWLRNLLLRENGKMAKVLETVDAEYSSIGLSLLPHGASFRTPFDSSTEQGKGGRTFCAFSTPECRSACLVNTGQRALESGAFAASYLYSHLLREMPQEFAINLFDRTVHTFIEAHEGGFRRFVRYNVLSDLPWELLAPGMMEAICERARHYVGVRRWRPEHGLAFYDYTKIPRRTGVEGVYDITFSFSGSKHSTESMLDVLEGRTGAAKRTAVVFVKREQDRHRDTGVPYRKAPGLPLKSEERWHSWRFMGQKVWNGDLSDIRPLDPPGVKVVGLTYKTAFYKVFAEDKTKKFTVRPVVPVTDLDRLLPTFIVRVMQPDPDAPPVVVGTQDLENRRLALPVWRE